MGRKGYFIEPTTGAALAGLKKYSKHNKKNIVVSILTWIGLKAAEKIGRLCPGFPKHPGKASAIPEAGVRKEILDDPLDRLI